MKITCPMCDGTSVPRSTSREIVLDCDWCGGRGWIDESEHPFYAHESNEMESEHPSMHQQRVPVKKWCLLKKKRVYS